MKRSISCVLFALVMARMAYAQTVTGSILPSPDATVDREPAIIVQNVDLADHVITSWINNDHLKVASINESNLTTGAWDTNNLPCPFDSGCTNSNDSGDPMLAENPYPNGMKPKRVYLIGASRRASGENQISVWSTDRGGANYNNQSSWTKFVALDHQANGTWVADKPSIAVSWAPSTRGQVYEAHLLINSSAQCFWATQFHTKIVANRVETHEELVNGILTEINTITQVLNIDSGAVCASSPIIVLDPWNAGRVNVVWINWETNEINAVSSLDNFQTIYRKPAGTLFGPGNDNLATCLNEACNELSAKINARSMLMARFNAISGTIGITWHTHETADPNSSDVKFVEFTPSAPGFGPVRTVTDSAGTSGAQWNPALDYDSNGQYLVSYYDTNGVTQSSTQFNYRVKTARLASNGVRTGAADTLLTSTASNLRIYPKPYPNDPNSNPGNGEYMDIWNWNGKFYAGFIQIGIEQGDAVVVRITPPTPTVFHQRTPVDFNGDHISDVVNYRHGTWIAYNQNTGAQLWSVTTDNFADSIPAPMDYDGDGRTEFTIFRPGIGWYFYNDNGTLLKSIPITLAGAKPAPADYDGNGTDDVVVYRNGTWTKYDFNTGNVAWNVTTDNFTDGVPVPMDYDGDGRAEFTVFRPGINWHFYNEDGSYYSGVWVGEPGPVPAPGDYDGNGTEDAVAFNRNNPSWIFYNINTPQYVRTVITPGGSANGDPIQPTPLDYDGDGSVDLTYMNGGPWDFWLDDGTLRNAFWTGGNTGDLAMSRVQHTQNTP